MKKPKTKKSARPIENSTPPINEEAAQYLEHLILQGWSDVRLAAMMKMSFGFESDQTSALRTTILARWETDGVDRQGLAASRSREIKQIDELINKLLYETVEEANELGVRIKVKREVSDAKKLKELMPHITRLIGMRARITGSHKGHRAEKKRPGFLGVPELTDDCSDLKGPEE